MIMKTLIQLILVVILTVVGISCSNLNEKTKSNVALWLTTSDRKSLLEKQENLSYSTESANNTIITIDSTKQYQSIDGFGYTLTGGSAMLINSKLNPAQRDSLLQELFTTKGNGIGISYIRISVGSSDLDDHVFSYDDMPAG